MDVFVDSTRDESLIFELLDLQANVLNQGSALWFLEDLANEQDAEGTMLKDWLPVRGAYMQNVPLMCLVFLMGFHGFKTGNIRWSTSSRYKGKPRLLLTAAIRDPRIMLKCKGRARTQVQG
ncbi:Uncharacterized protein Fot_28539 [Forsythia ovata]|uniref:Uncharacterized protein n=1 Tax=Forsythia ovata TaxID=205694 RepID=A0ABD1TPQ9_9LAMI